MKTIILLVPLLAACAQPQYSKPADKPPYWGQRIEQPAPRNDAAFAERFLFEPHDSQDNSGIVIKRRSAHLEVK